MLLAPGLAGMDVMKQISEDNDIALPIFSHPAFRSYVMGRSGISHSVLFGQLARLAGADATIYLTSEAVSPSVLKSARV